MSETPEPVEAEALPEPQLPSPSKDARTMAMLVHLLCIFTGFIGPLIIYLIKKDEDKFIAFHSLQAIYWGIAGIILAFTCVGLIVCLVFAILALVAANRGEWYKYPQVGDWAMNAVKEPNPPTDYIPSTTSITSRYLETPRPTLAT